MSDMQDTTLEQPVEEQPVEQPEAEVQPQPEPQPEWAQRFPGGPDEVYKAFRETKARMTQEAQQRAELERRVAEYEQQPQQDEYQDPWAALPPTIDETTQQQLATWAERDPAAAAQWAYENHHQVGPEIAGHLFQYWQQRDFWGAENWKSGVINQQYYAQMRQEMQQEFEPVRQHTTAQMSQLTLDLAQRSIPDWEVWAPRIVEFLEAPENTIWRQSIDAAGLGSEAAAERLYDIYAVLHARDQRTRGAVNTPQPAPAASAQTETTSTGQVRDDNGRFTTSTPTENQNTGRRTGRLSHL